MMYIVLAIILFASLWLIINIFSQKGKDEYSRTSNSYNRGTDNSYNKGVETTTETERKPSFTQSISRIFTTFFSFDRPPSRIRLKKDFDAENLAWCATFLEIDELKLRSILNDVRVHYTHFRMKKRSTGYRSISVPSKELLSIQQTIYFRALLSANIHPAATGFRRGVSIVDNAKKHLGKKEILKVDIKDFFGTIQFRSAKKAFTNIGYPPNIAHILAHLCCLRRHLPQGAPTSPTLSNIIAYEMDVKLTALAKEHKLTYTRYADDLTFSGNAINRDLVLGEINRIVNEQRLALNRKKTHFMPQNRRKIVTGISISSGEKLTIPKRKKREMRKNIHFILTRGLEAHQAYIKNSDPAYLKRILGYLNFWLLVEPENQYVKDSLEALKKIQ